MSHWLIPHSENNKLGGMATSIHPPDTCPDCPLKDYGCFGNTGPISWWWRKLAQGLKGTGWGDFLAQVRALPRRSKYRYGEVGDLPGKGNRLNVRLFKQLVRACRKLVVICYSHKPLWRKAEREAIQWAAEQGVIVNRSADSLAEADQFYDEGIAPVVVTVPDFETMPKYTPKGRRLTPCCEQTHGIKCADCLLCAKWHKTIVAFKAHGAQKKAITW